MFSKSLTACEEDLNRFKGAQIQAASQKRLKRLAGETLDSLDNSKQKLKLVCEIGEELIEMTNNTGSSIKQGDDAAKKVESELDVYGETFKKFLDEHDKIILKAEEEMSKKEDVTVVQKNGNNGDWQNFRPNSSLKPNPLEKDSTALEIQSFVEQFEAYITDGFQGPPKKDHIYIHLQPICDHIIWSSLIKWGILKVMYLVS